MRYTNQKQITLLQIIQQQQTIRAGLGRHADRIASKAHRMGLKR